jgi:hypothetical protein
MFYFCWLDAPLTATTQCDSTSMCDHRKIHAANARQAIYGRYMQHPGWLADRHLMPAALESWKCRQASCMARLNSRVPRAPASVSGGMAVELRRCVYNASTYRTAVKWPRMHSAESFTRLHTSSTGILSQLSVSVPSVEKLKSGRCASRCKRPLNVRFVHGLPWRMPKISAERSQP